MPFSPFVIKALVDTITGGAHGRERGSKRIDARIARLAITSASSLALFLIETWEQQQHRALPLRD